MSYFNYTIKIVFDSFNNKKDELNLTDEDWANNTNYAQEAKGDPASSENLRSRIKVFKEGTTAYVLANGSNNVVFPAYSARMFQYADALTAIEFNSIDTSSVEFMSRMFEHCFALTSLDLSGWNTSNVRYMESVFDDCSALTSLDLSGWNTSNVQDMASVFSDCSNLTSLDLSGWNTSNVRYMDSMFSYCSNLTSLDLSGFDTSSVQQMRNMFYGCSALTEVTLGENFSFVGTEGYLPDAASGKAWYVQGDDETTFTPAELAEYQSTVTEATTYVVHEPVAPVLYRGFMEKYNLKNNETITKVVFDSWDNQKSTLGLTDASWAINTNYVQEAKGDPASSDNLRGRIKLFKDEETHTAYVLAEKDFNVAFPINSTAMFMDAVKLNAIEFKSVDTSNTQYFGNMFENCTGLTSLDLSNFDTSKAIRMAATFFGCTKLQKIDLTNWNVKQVGSFKEMFFSCYNLTDLDISGFIAPKVNDTAYMFERCSRLKKIDLSGFNTSNVTDMTSMFEHCEALTDLKLNVSTFSTAKVTNMSNMFSVCSSLKKLDLSFFNTAKVTNMTYMFYNCSALTELNVSSFNTAKVKNMSHMFENCSSLTKLDLSNFSTGSATDVTDKFKGCSALNDITFGPEYRIISLSGCVPEAAEGYAWFVDFSETFTAEWVMTVEDIYEYQNGGSLDALVEPTRYIKHQIEAS